jgi:hypothetical protein
VTLLALKPPGSTRPAANTAPTASVICQSVTTASPVNSSNRHISHTVLAVGVVFLSLVTTLSIFLSVMTNIESDLPEFSQRN